MIAKFPLLAPRDCNLPSHQFTAKRPHQRLVGNLRQKLISDRRGVNSFTWICVEWVEVSDKAHVCGDDCRESGIAGFTWVVIERLSGYNYQGCSVQCSFIRYDEFGEDQGRCRNAVHQTLMLGVSLYHCLLQAGLLFALRRQVHNRRAMLSHPLQAAHAQCGRP